MSTFREIHTGLIGLLEEIRDALDGQLSVEPAWGTTNVQTLPAAWIAQQPEAGSTSDRTDCAITDELRLLLRIAVEPTADGAGQDTDEIVDLVDVVLPLVDRAMNDSRRRLGLGVYVAYRERFYVERVALGETNAQTLVLPLYIAWQHGIPTPEET